MPSRCILFLAIACVLLAQDPPVIDPRGVLNGFTKTAALASVARGGILEIDGQNLGPDAGVTASGLPLPTKLGNPPIQVLIAGKAVPLFSATPNPKILIANVKANTVAAIGMDQNARQPVLLVVRIP
jgi:hypothetical protein